ncbi:hypothetical protein HRbin39_01525 [bacterium HR39]|nr:hypothetical protein HRbin39_01525 [bacterium HR39]
MQVASALPDARPLLPRLAEACREGRLALFLDFDGTLAPSCRTPTRRGCRIGCARPWSGSRDGPSSRW